jgi:DNA primase
VATLGTALSAEQVQLLRGLMGDQAEAVLVFDGDAAGVNAARRSTAIFNQNHLEARILVLPARHDPDSFIRDKGREAFVQAAAKAKNMVAFLLDNSIDRHGSSTHGKLAVVNEMAAVLTEVKDSLALSLYAKEVAERLGVDQEAVMARVGRAMDGQSRPMAPAGLAQRQDERQIIAMILQFPELACQIDHQALDQVLEDQGLKKIAATLLRRSEVVGGHVGALIQDFADPEQMKLVAGLAMDNQGWNPTLCLDAITRFVEQRRARLKLDDLREQIGIAEKNQDTARREYLQEQMQKIAVQSDRRKRKPAPGSHDRQAHGKVSRF